MTTVFDEDDNLLDLTGARVLFVAWNASTDTTIITKDSNVSAAQVEIQDQVTNTGEAKIFIDPTDLAAVAVLMHNIWIDLAGGQQHLVVRPSRFEILASRRS